MSKTKLTLTASPRFNAMVPIPISGGEPVELELTFKARTRDEYRTFLQALAEKDDVQIVMDVCSGWALEDKFNQDNVAVLVNNYFGATAAILEIYYFELTRARLKNS